MPRRYCESPYTRYMAGECVSLRVPDARSQILIVRSPAPDANHWFPGSTARARTQPRWPEMTRKSFHGACHCGFCWRTVSRRTRLVDVVVRCGVGPCAIGGALAEAVPVIRVIAVDVPFICDLVWVSDAFAIISAICGSLAWSSVFGFFLLAARPACTFACFCARTAGSSLTSSYSLRIRDAMLAFWARS